MTGLMSSSELAVALKSSTFNLFPKHVPVPAGSLRPIERRDQPTAVVTAKYPLVWPLTAYGNCRRTRLRPSPAGLTPRVALTGASNFIRLLLFHLSHINDAAAPLPSRCGLHLFCRPHVTVADPLRANDGAQWPCPYCRRTDTQAPRPLHQTQASENS